MAHILLIDDDPDFSSLLQEQLQHNHEVRWLALAEEGLELLAEERYDLVLLDNKMPGMSGLEFLAAAEQRQVSSPIILMTSAHNDRTVIQAVNLGAFAYLIKPLDQDQMLAELEPVICDALRVRPPQRVPLPHPDSGDEDDSLIVGRCRAMLEVLMRIGNPRLLNGTDPVLILGETGTGKDLVARAIHTNGPRASKPFVAMNCTAFHENLLDDELFGHEVGAFTGADRLRKGCFEHAHGGTLFLDELGDMPLTLQAKLLRVLENREISRLGSSDTIQVDVRVLAATHRDLKTLVRQEKFRADLLFRLDGHTIRLPPLRERQGDIPLLVQRFLGRMFAGSGSTPSLHPAALERLGRYSWPGNIRQLQKVLCRAVGSCRGSQIQPEDLDFGELDGAADQPAGCTSEEDALAQLRAVIAWAWKSDRQTDLFPWLQQCLERELLRYGLAQSDLSQVKMAERLGMARNTFRARLKQYGLEEPAGDKP